MARKFASEIKFDVAVTVAKKFIEIGKYSEVITH